MTHPVCHSRANAGPLSGTRVILVLILRRMDVVPWLASSLPHRKKRTASQTASLWNLSDYFVIAVAASVGPAYGCDRANRVDEKAVARIRRLRVCQKRQRVYDTPRLGPETPVVFGTTVMGGSRGSGPTRLMCKELSWE